MGGTPTSTSTSSSSASFHRPWLQYVNARLAVLVKVLGCPWESTLKFPFKFACSSLASFHRPWFLYADARLAMLAKESECSWPSTLFLLLQPLSTVLGSNMSMRGWPCWLRWMGAPSRGNQLLPELAFEPGLPLHCADQPNLIPRYAKAYFCCIHTIAVRCNVTEEGGCVRGAYPPQSPILKFKTAIGRTLTNDSAAHPKTASITRSCIKKAAIAMWTRELVSYALPCSIIVRSE